MRPSTLEPSAHVRRATTHFQVGVALDEATSNEWAAVCYFYAGYHLVKAALLEDPIFDDPSRCAAKHVDLMMDDRYTDRHQMRRSQGGGRGWGINDLVLLLYRPIVGDYDRLHQASISVRYRDGLPSGALPVLRSCADRIQASFDAGHLVAS